MGLLHRRLLSLLAPSGLSRSLDYLLLTCLVQLGIRLATSALVRLCCLDDNGVSIVKRLELSAAASDDFGLFYLEHAIDNSRVRVGTLHQAQIAFELLAVLLVLNVHVLEQLLRHLARHLVLVVEAR